MPNYGVPGKGVDLQSETNGHSRPLLFSLSMWRRWFCNSTQGKCPLLFIDSVEVHWMPIPVLFNEFPMDGQLGFQPFAITNNAEMYILDSPEKVIEMELLSQRIFTI